MKMHRFTGATTRAVLQQVRASLGSDAIILSSKKTDEGVEILAARDGDLAGLPPLPGAAATDPASRPGPATGSLPDLLNSMQVLLDQIEAQVARAPAGAAPATGGMADRLRQAGLSPQLVAHLCRDLPAAGVEKAVGDRLAALLPTMSADLDLIDEGGVLALVGPTGIGKTTTVAKLAAHCVFRYGSGSVGLLTTDNYRIGAYEQLRLYGEILGVPVLKADSRRDLAEGLARLSGRHLVLIDTVGMSQRDSRVAEQAAMLNDTSLKRILLLNATASPSTLEEVEQAYRAKGIHGCIMTKTDEAGEIGGLLDLLARRRIPLHYLTNGQRVPEDLHYPDAAALAHLVLASRHAVGQAFLAWQRPVFRALSAQPAQQELLDG